MNKGLRNEIAQQKKKNRLRKYTDIQLAARWTNALKSHATVCSCFMCSHLKYNRSKMKAMRKDIEAE